MRLAVATVLLAAAARAAAPDPDPGFASTLPAAVGNPSGWDVVTGDFETTRLQGFYRFYVNPGRQAMYQLMRYRVELLGQRKDEARRKSGERVAFVRHPGTPEPMLIWACDATNAAWRPIAPDTDEYRIELRVLMGVLAVHRAARLDGSP